MKTGRGKKVTITTRAQCANKGKSKGRAYYYYNRILRCYYIFEEDATAAVADLYGVCARAPECVYIILYYILFLRGVCFSRNANRSGDYTACRWWRGRHGVAVGVEEGFYTLFFYFFY